jgi:hypothetical protein
MAGTVLYQPQAPDTSIEADRFLFQRLRQQSVPVEIVESWPLERYHSPIILCLKGGEDDVTPLSKRP